MMALIFLSNGLFAKSDDLEKGLKIVNEEIKRLNLPWKTKLSYEEHALGLLLRQHPEVKLIPKPTKLGLPSSIDWRNYNGKNYITPIKNQSSCGSCWAFGAVGTAEAIWKIEQDRPDLNPDLSEQELVSCSQAGDCGGGYHDEAAEWIRTRGLVPEYCFSYFASNMPCNYCSEGEYIYTTIQEWNWVTTIDEDINAIKQALVTGPVSTTMEIYSDFYYYYESGVYVKVPGSTVVGYHVVVIVGYDDALDCWICKNSWGADWGENGYFRIKRGQAGIGESHGGLNNILGTYTIYEKGVKITKVGEGY
jgi:C1A family cysteine protease